MAHVFCCKKWLSHPILIVVVQDGMVDIGMITWESWDTPLDLSFPPLNELGLRFLPSSLTTGAAVGSPSSNASLGGSVGGESRAGILARLARSLALPAGLVGASTAVAIALSSHSQSLRHRQSSLCSHFFPRHGVAHPLARAEKGRGRHFFERG